jgi:hypothetical protein
MPFCPDCETEYAPGVDACAECGVPLVSTLLVRDTPAGPPGDEEFVEAWTARTHAEAEAIRELLEHNGIAAYLSESSIEIPPADHRVMVAEGELAAAREIIEGYAEGQHGGSTDDADVDTDADTGEWSREGVDEEE